LAGGMS